MNIYPYDSNFTPEHHDYSATEDAPPQREQKPVKDDTNTSTLTIVLIAVGAGVVLIAVSVSIVIVIKKRRKKN